MATRLSNPFPRYLNANIAALDGGKLNFYVDDAGTTRKKTYNDNALSSANANPVILSVHGALTPRHTNVRGH